MDLTTILNIILAVAAVVGAIVAVIGAHSARKANRLAGEHEEAALAAARDSASEAKRAADALVESNAIAKKMLPKERLKLIQHGATGYQVQNISDETLWGLGFTEVEGDNILLGQELPDRLYPGESIFFDHVKTFDSPPTTTIIVSYGFPDAGSERVNWRRTLN